MNSSNFLSIPFRRSTHISLSSTLRQYISTKYDQHPDMFKHDLEVVDALRRDAVDVREAHPSGVKKLQKYAGQLTWIAGKFPAEVCSTPFNQELGRLTGTVREF
jgi:programmed cell death 6-interacting protein